MSLSNEEPRRRKLVDSHQSDAVVQGNNGVEREAFVVFQGGGAKGISHVGAVAALKDAQLKIVGVAGTSAGAIVAALTAAKYSAEDLLATDGSGRHILSTIDPSMKSATQLFGDEGWKRLTSLIGLFRSNTLPKNEYVGENIPSEESAEVQPRPKVYIAKNVAKRWLKAAWWRWLLLVATIAVLADFPMRIDLFGHVWLLAPPHAFCVVLNTVVIGTFMFFEARWFARQVVSIGAGLSPTSRISEIINQALIDNLEKTAVSSHAAGGEGWTWDDAKKGGITFAQFAEVGGIPLRIVATDVTSQTVRLFSAEDTPSVIVSEAVCASAGLPIVFEVKGIEIEDSPGPTKSMHYFLDGGLLSNLPLWVFDEDRSLNEDALTIGFTLEQSANSEKSLSSTGMSGFAWFLPALESIVSGPKTIHHRAIEGLLLVSVPTGLEVLSFDRKNSEYVNEVVVARRAALAQMRFQLYFPMRLRGNLESLSDVISQALDQLAAGVTPVQLAVRSYGTVDPQTGFSEWHLRLSVLVQRPGFSRTLRVMASTDPAVGWPSRRGRVVPFADFGSVWDWQNPVYMFDVVPNVTPLNPNSAWLTALPILPSVGPVNTSASAVILVVESSLRPTFLPYGPLTLADENLLALSMLAITQTIEKSLHALTVAFGQKYGYANSGLVHNNQFDEHIRRAQLWQ
ncbi:MAG TPA: patatin-like phospholipase family protein [Luteibacter sp.]|jgi:NTE family protein|uniref:patatin-like phospholipase family protein n=1 Tax=Luteibacter sp. TaxID=1886636 RepID=UPI002F3F8EDA